MNDLPRQQLRTLITTYGRSLCDDPQRCEALLKDLCHGQYRGEIAVLVGALKEGVAADLLASQNSVPREVLLLRLKRRLHDNLALTDDAALWAVESWALALGVSLPPVSPPYRQDNYICTGFIIQDQPPTSSEGSSPAPSRPSSWKTLGILGILGIAVVGVIVSHHPQSKHSKPLLTKAPSPGENTPSPSISKTPQPSATETAPSPAENTPSPSISGTQQPSATENEQLVVYRITYISGSIPYEAILSVRGNYGTLRTTFNDRGQTRIVDQNISFRRISQDVTDIAGSNPVIAGTNVQDTNYSPDNFFTKTESNGSKIFFTCDNNAIQAHDTSRCSPVKVEKIH